MSEDLYQKELLRLAADAHGAGRLDGDCCTGRAANAMCGDSVIFDARLDGGRIAESANEVRGCVLVQASASLLDAHASGETHASLQSLHDGVSAMLTGAEAPPGKWSGFQVFRPASAYRSRHSCVLLPIEALLKALEDG
jgi:nitrogen fixation protein NifU and related proteins